MKFTKPPFMFKLIWCVSFSAGSYEETRLERKLKIMAAKFQRIKEELRNFTTVNLIADASSILEKVFWALIAILGTLFIIDVVVIQLDYWRENPILVTKQTLKLSDMPLPSMTFCHKGLQKYGIVERLGNYIDPEKEIPEEVFNVRNEFIEVQFKRIVKDSGINFCEWLFDKNNSLSKDHPILKGKSQQQLEAMELECYVSYYLRIRNVL